MRVRAETARVLITVKTAPQPSASYGDTVCVAGIRIDGSRSDWIRLYPIPFRWLDSAQKFRKYDVIELEVRRRDQDSRQESYSPTIDTIRLVEHLDPWAPREEILRQVSRTTVCALRAGVQARHDAPSLGLIDVEAVTGLEFEDHPGWSEAEQRKIAASLQMQSIDLFGSVKVPPKLMAPQLKVRYKYQCAESGCPSHVGQILDWELSELQRRIGGVSGERLRVLIQEKFIDMMWNSRRRSSFFRGNFEDPKKRQNFSVLGVYYPDVVTATKATLFDI
jgi:hypothetical protein